MKYLRTNIWSPRSYNAHHQPDAMKQGKLRFMAATADAELLRYAAWPQDTLFKIPGGPVVGFLMPKIIGRAPIHILYSPAHRKQDYPEVAWDFLLFSARNMAAAFDAVHHYGHVLGDVNQGNVLVGGEGIVVRSGRLRGLDGQVQYTTVPEPRRIGRGKRMAGLGGDQDGSTQWVVRAWRLREVDYASGICEADDLQLFADIRIAR